MMADYRQTVEDETGAGAWHTRGNVAVFTITITIAHRHDQPPINFAMYCTKDALGM